MSKGSGRQRRADEAWLAGGGLTKPHTRDGIAAARRLLPVTPQRARELRAYLAAAPPVEFLPLPDDAAAAKPFTPGSGKQPATRLCVPCMLVTNGASKCGRCGNEKLRRLTPLQGRDVLLYQRLVKTGGPKTTKDAEAVERLLGWLPSKGKAAREARATLTDWSPNHRSPSNERVKLKGTALWASVRRADEKWLKSGGLSRPHTRIGVAAATRLIPFHPDRATELRAYIASAPHRSKMPASDYDLENGIGPDAKTGKAKAKKPKKPKKSSGFGPDGWPKSTSVRTVSGGLPSLGKRR